MPTTRRKQRTSLKPVVLHLGPAPGSSGGISAVIEEISAMKSDGFDARPVPTWVAGTKRGALAATVKAFAVMLHHKRRWHIAHVHMSEFGSFVREGAVVLWARILWRPAVITLHGARFEEHARKAPRLTQAVLNLASHVLCLGPDHERLVKNIAPNASTSRIFNPIADKTLTDAEELSGRHSPRSFEPLRVAFVGEVGERKGFDVLLSAWPLVREQIPNAQLVVAGPIAAGAPEPAGDGIEYKGPLTRRDALTLLSGSTVSVLPSRAEVLPVVILESVAAGTPVIYTQVGEWSVLADCPAVQFVDLWNCESHEAPGRLAAAILKAAATPITKSMQAAGREWVRQRASSTVIAGELAHLYSGLTEGVPS